jgi:hypothetical protein
MAAERNRMIAGDGRKHQTMDLVITDSTFFRELGFASTFEPTYSGDIGLINKRGTKLL